MCANFSLLHRFSLKWWWWGLIWQQICNHAHSIVTYVQRAWSTQKAKEESTKWMRMDSPKNTLKQVELKLIDILASVASSMKERIEHRAGLSMIENKNSSTEQGGACLKITIRAQAYSSIREFYMIEFLPGYLTENALFIPKFPYFKG